VVQVKIAKLLLHSLLCSFSTYQTLHVCLVLSALSEFATESHKMRYVRLCFVILMMVCHIWNESLMTVLILCV